MFSSLEKGLDNIWAKDAESQRHYIEQVCVARGGSYLKIIEEMKGFFVPNKKYMYEYFGASILSPMYDCYDHTGNCVWMGHLVIPIRNVKGDLVGFTGYNHFTKFGEEDPLFAELARYKESSQQVMDKSKFFLCPLGYEKALNDGYIILIDGFFDALSVANQGYNSIAILGSSLSKEVKFYLRFIDRIYVAGDNDNAGFELEKRLKSIHPRALPLEQSKCKDIDEFIKLYPSEFHEGMKAISSKIPIPIELKA